MGEVSKSKEFSGTSEIIFKNASLIGSTGANKSHINGAIDMVQKRLVMPVVEESFAFDDVKEAFQKMKQKESVGRIVLIP